MHELTPAHNLLNRVLSVNAVPRGWREKHWLEKSLESEPSPMFCQSSLAQWHQNSCCCVQRGKWSNWRSPQGQNISSFPLCRVPATQIGLPGAVPFCCHRIKENLVGIFWGNSIPRQPTGAISLFLPHPLTHPSWCQGPFRRCMEAREGGRAKQPSPLREVSCLMSPSFRSSSAPPWAFPHPCKMVGPSPLSPTQESLSATLQETYCISSQSSLPSLSLLDPCNMPYSIFKNTWATCTAPAQDCALRFFYWKEFPLTE